MASQTNRASAAEKRLRVLVVDDHALLREGLVDVLRAHSEFEQIEQATSYHEAVEKARKFRPDVILADVWLDESHGIELLTQLRTAMDEPKVIILSVQVSDRMLLEALRAGVRGLLDRSADASQLVEGVSEVARNETFISKAIVKRLISHLTSESHDEPSLSPAMQSLTEREQQILRHVAAGQTNKTIAGNLYLSDGTVRAHLRSILRKLDVTNRVQAATMALRLGMTLPIDSVVPASSDGSDTK